MVLNARELLILDTGPLWELLSFLAVTRLGYKKLQKNLRHFRDDRQYQLYSNFVAQFRRKTTTAGVVVELYRFIRETENTGQLELWEELYREFRQMGMDEQAVSLLTMPIADVAKRGPTDMSLISCARDNAAAKPVVLTIDRELWSLCRRIPIDSVTLDEITAG